MKIHKRFYTGLARPLAPAPVASSSATQPISRVRSNSVPSARSLYTSSSTLPFAFFDPPPPSSRPGSANGVISTRLAAEVKAELEGSHNSPHSSDGHNPPQSQSHSSGPPPYSPAITYGHSESTSSHLHNASYNLFFPHPTFAPISALENGPQGTIDAHASTRLETRYHLDVGAYGIPKHSRGIRLAGRSGQGGLSLGSDPRLTQQNGALAVQVGEDAYFIRNNAMGVADGVGGWSKVCPAGKGDEQSPSAMFAHRLMHYCCEEVEAKTSSDWMEPDTDDVHEMREQLDDSLEDLADGLDVLMILEKAYSKTMSAHIVSPPHATPSSTFMPPDSKRHLTTAAAPPLPNAPPASNSAAASPASSIDATSCPGPSAPPPNSPQVTVPKPLLAGSSTALLAILQHPAVSPPKAPHRTHLFSPKPIRPTTHAVLRIAHLGDCMGMLVRGEEVVWRTEEMWWNFNTPVQLGPASSTRPQDAQVFTLPVQADDILILASDGLSDNLWDEDILDEVVRFRRSFLSGTHPAGTTASMLGRGALAGMLSEALCSRARRVSQRRGEKGGRGSKSREVSAKVVVAPSEAELEDDVPFARRAREEGRWFQGGKPDDISVLVAVVSPVD